MSFPFPPGILGLPGCSAWQLVEGNNWKHPQFSSLLVREEYHSNVTRLALDDKDVDELDDVSTDSCSLAIAANANLHEDID